ncbi:MAG TPA: molybdopterin-dependent oxidoreductase [Thermodesulfovibrionales bacterium]|nr:molybdopterin-dependent oxidoreductase [Thermodesulfovibrionales bacterium]
MTQRRYTRRDFLKTTGVLSAVAAVGVVPAPLFADERRLVRFPEKTDLILLTSRPPQLETPLSYFKELVTPNNALFVRWHISNVPTSVDLGQWRLKVGGNADKELRLSMEDLKKYEKITYAAVIQCSGNGRSLFEPRVAGGQWKNGAMGNVVWSGARLRDILNDAGMKAGSVDVSFNGLDTPPLQTVPDFVKSLPVDMALEDDIIVAYEMNGEPLTMLNGFPARIVVPGWYATYWVKSLSEITVLPRPFEEFWMKSAYRIPDNPCACTPAGTPPKKTVPLNRMNTRSLVIEPADGTTLRLGKPLEIMGIAFSGGYSIRDVIVSTDSGKRWGEARLGQDKGRYSWIQWFYEWKPEKAGKYTIMVKATNSIGESQPFETLWNPSGYLWNKIEKTGVVVA